MSRPWVQTFTGLAVHPFSPEPSEIKLEDIAHSLSLICRFNGHCRVHYSVAEHSLRCAEKAPKKLRCKIRLHDAAETVLGDIVRPVKGRLCAWDDAQELRRIKEIEEQILRTIFIALEVEWPTDQEWEQISYIDNRMVMTEGRDLMVKPPIPWDVPAKPYKGYVINPMPAQIVERAFIREHLEDMGRGAATR
jgi:hypothetical protein